MDCVLAGHGNWGANLMRCLATAENCRPRAVCEPAESRHREIKRRYPGIEIDLGLEASLARPEIDAVVLASPAELHYDQARQVLRAGKHVFVEKPLALTSAQAQELTDLAESAGLTLMVGHTFLYNDAVNFVKKYIEDGELGDIYYAYFQRLNLGRVRSDVDAMWNLAPHDIAIANYWFGESPCRVEARGISYLQPDIDDVCFMHLFYPSGRFANIHVSWLDPLKTRQAVVVGTKRMIQYDDSSNDEKIRIYNKGFDRRMIGDTPFDSFCQFQLIHRSGDVTIPAIKYREPLQLEIQHFVDCVNNKTRPLTDGRNGVEVVRILEAAQKNKSANRWNSEAIE